MDDFLDLLLTFILKHKINKPTRVYKTSATLIDNFLVNFDYKDSIVVESALSDHHAQLLSLVCGVASIKKEEPPVSRRIFSRTRLEQYRTELLNESWDWVLNENCVDRVYELFINRIRAVLNRAIPLRKTKPIQQKTKYWITAGIRKSCARKRQPYKQRLDNEVSESYYKRYSNILKKLIKQAKRMYNTNFIAGSENKARATWSVINKLNKKYTKKVTVLDCIESEVRVIQKKKFQIK